MTFCFVEFWVFGEQIKNASQTRRKSIQLVKTAAGAIIAKSSLFGDLAYTGVVHENKAV